MNRLIKRLQGGQKGFTLIELLVVIAILGVISAVVALNLSGFFGRGTLEAANMELHQAQTAIIAAMADARSGNVTAAELVGGEGGWAGQNETVVATGAGGVEYDAANYAYGPFRARYHVESNGAITNAFCDYDDGWGPSIVWDPDYMAWKRAGS